MKFYLSLLTFFVLLSITVEGREDVIETAKCFSDQSFLYAVASVLQFENREFPLPPVGTEREETTCNLPTYSLNYKNLRLGIQNYGNFFQDYCRRRCVHAVHFRESIPCGVRRPPPVYTPIVDWSLRTYNCSNLAFPISIQDQEDDLYLMKTLKKADPASVFPNTTFNYLKQFNIRGFQIETLRTNLSTSQVIQFTKNLLNYSPTTSVISLRIQDTYGDYLTRTQNARIPEFLSLIKQFEKIEEIILQGINISDWDQPHADLSNLRGVSLENVFINDVPAWLEKCPKLNFVRLKNILNDNSNLDSLNNLPELEHFTLEKSEITKIKKGFLEKSQNLISLTIICSLVNEIEAGVFDHLVNLKFLTIRRNRLTSFPAGMLLNLNNLISFDLYGLGPIYSSTEKTYATGCEQAQSTVSAFTSDVPICVDVMPDFANPNNLIGLEISQCPAVLNQLYDGYLTSFTELQHLRLSDLNLTGFANMGLESLCKLKSLVYSHNLLSDEDWLTEDFYVNNAIETTHSLQTSFKSKVAYTKISPSLLAMIKENSKFGFDIYNSISSIFSYMAGTNSSCEIEILKFATEFDYKIQSESCAVEGQSRIERVKQLEERRLNDNKCLLQI